MARRRPRMADGLSQADRDRFDALVEQAIEALPPEVRARLDIVSVAGRDEPTREMLVDVGVDMSNAAEVSEAKREMCGLHTGRAVTERSVDDPPEPPPQVHIFRRGVLDLAGGWEAEDDEGAVSAEDRISM